MSEEIGIIEEIQPGRGTVFKLFGIPILGASDDKLCISKLYDLTWRNIFRYKQLGTYEVATPTIFKERDIVKVTLDNKRIVSIEKTGVLTRKDMLKHDLLGTGAISVATIFAIMLIIAIWW